MVCHDCNEKGFTAKDLRKYTCGLCSSIFGHTKFESGKIKDHNRRGDTLRCLDCKDKLQCAACKTAYPKTEWTAKEREHHTSERKTALICKACRAKGCTAHDYYLYECVTCLQEFGAKRFDATQLNNYNHHNQRKLQCLSCVAVVKARVEALRPKL